MKRPLAVAILAIVVLLLGASMALTVMAQQAPPAAPPTTQTFDPVPPPTYFPETVALMKRVDALEARIKVLETHNFEHDTRASKIEERVAPLEARPTWKSCTSRLAGVPGTVTCELVP